MSEKKRKLAESTIPQEFAEAILRGESVEDCFFIRQNMGSVFVMLLVNREQLSKATHEEGSQLGDEQYRCLVDLARRAANASKPRGQG